MKNTILCLLLLLFPGCIQIAQFARDHIITSPGMAKSINHLDYKLIGTIGPDMIWLENEYNLRVKMGFDLVTFPTNEELKKEFLFSKKESNALSNLAIIQLKNYFGSHKIVTLVTLKIASNDNRSKNYLLDVKTKNRDNTLAEIMVSNGLYYVFEDLAKSSSHKHLLKLQAKAQRSRLVIWKNITAYNPLWHD